MIDYFFGWIASAQITINITLIKTIINNIIIMIRMISRVNPGALLPGCLPLGRSNSSSSGALPIITCNSCWSGAMIHSKIRCKVILIRWVSYHHLAQLLWIRWWCTLWVYSQVQDASQVQQQDYDHSLTKSLQSKIMINYYANVETRIMFSC